MGIVVTPMPFPSALGVAWITEGATAAVVVAAAVSAAVVAAAVVPAPASPCATVTVVAALYTSAMSWPRRVQSNTYASIACCRNSLRHSVRRRSQSDGWYGTSPLDSRGDEGQPDPRNTSEQRPKYTKLGENIPLELFGIHPVLTRVIGSSSPSTVAHCDGNGHGRRGVESSPSGTSTVDGNGLSHRLRHCLSIPLALVVAVVPSTATVAVAVAVAISVVLGSEQAPEETVSVD